MKISLEHKLGGLILTGFHGHKITSDHHIVRDIEQYKIGGVILFDKLLAKGAPLNNIINADQVSTLTRELQTISSDSLFIATDQEGGMVSRFRKEAGFPTTQSAYLLGSHSTTEATKVAGEQTATMLASIGVNFNFAPVVDLNCHPSNPIISKYERSFSERPDTVIAHAATWIDAHNRKNIISCLKHFPGHGSANSDSHQGFVDITHTWKKKELIPFQELHKRQLVDSIMTGHLFNQHFDSTYPATLSKSTLQKLLREKINYDGVVLSDDMQMGAITKFYGFEEACCRAIMAGVDILVIGNNLIYDTEIVPRLISYFKQAIDNGTLSEYRINEAWQRVQLLKTKYNLKRKTT